ncbi:tyrosine-type recombinase/integrase [Bradyrhizobium sp. LLZ17]|uniref:Tyrosine-type recombinase/integrase n=1 Tax=Bradyrhizobium sp. LLZ17 TaxID=3239388 RepID=A0AB39XI47_9BRAD
MAKTLREAPITTANARAKLSAGVHWRSLDPDVHLGYRKGRRGGVWLVRWRNGFGYRQKPIGTADDAIKEGTLDFNAAVKTARREVVAARLEAKAVADGPAVTVGLAAERYVAERDARHSKRAGRQIRSDAARRLGRYLLGQPARGKQGVVPAAPLADVAIHLLKEADLLAWRAGLPETLKETAKQRLINDLKAALNRAFTANRKRLDPALPSIIKYGLKAEPADDDENIPLARENQILSDPQVSALLRAARNIDASDGWEGDLFRLVVVLAATGARFSQVARMRVGDYQRTAGRLLIPASRKGKGKSGSVPVPVGKDVLDAIVPAVSGRAGDEFLLMRWRHTQVPGSIRWIRADRGPWQTASELTRPWDDIRGQAGMSQVIPYALRHSSIVRCIRQGLPIRLVAALHDTSVQMIEKHYARWITDGLEELVARSVVPLVPQGDENVIQISA